MYHLELKPFRRSLSQTWEKDIERLIDRTAGVAHFVPACEVREEETAYVIGVDLPGVVEEDLTMEVKDNQLHLSGERKSQAPTEKVQVLRSEVRLGKFARVFTLPQNVRAEGIVANFEHGVLTLVLPKEEKTRPMKITLSDRKNPTVAPELKS